jgi:GT2 family glycosyltransferase
MSDALLTIIVVDYHSRPEIDSLMRSIDKFEPGIPVLISSNSLYSAPERLDFRGAFPQATVLFNDRNLGYAGGVNQALRHVTTPYVALLNPDVELLMPLATSVSQVFQKNDKLAAFTPVVLNGTGQDTTVARRFWVPYFAIARLMERVIPIPYLQHVHDRYLRNDCPKSRFAPVDFVSGGTMIVNMAAYRDVGGMDERYFLYMEDVDWCRSFWEAGWWVAIEPTLKVVHHAHHDSTRSLWKGAFARTTRAHLASYWKYYRKWGGRSYCPSDDHQFCALMRNTVIVQ